MSEKNKQPVPRVCQACGGSGEEIPFPAESQLKGVPMARRAEMKEHLINRHEIFESIDLLLTMNTKLLLEKKMGSASDVAIQVESLVATAKANVVDGEIDDALYNLILLASYCVWACEKASYPLPSDVRRIVKSILEDEGRKAAEEDEDDDDEL